jgi:hypothetical protein
MIYLNEWFPNPLGNDNCKKNCGWNVEFVELFNRSSSSVSLGGWALWTGGKAKKVFLSGRIMAGGYAVFTKAQTKLSLKNNDGALWLYGPGGIVVDHAMFVGTAPIGKSFSRVDYGTEDTQHFAFLDPTPGALNEAFDNVVTVRHYLENVPLDPPLGMFQFLWLLFGAVAALTAVWIYLFYKNENLSQLIFQRDAGAR